MLAVFSKDMNIIAVLSDAPVPSGDLTEAQFKAKFDEGGLALKQYINNTLIPYITALESTIGQSAAKLTNARNFSIADATDENTGTDTGFNGTQNAKLHLPATIKADIVGDVTGNASTATALGHYRYFSVTDGTHEGTKVQFDGTGPASLPLPATIDAKLGTVTLTSASYGASLPGSGTAGQIFFLKKG